MHARKSVVLFVIAAFVISAGITAAGAFAKSSTDGAGPAPAVGSDQAKQTAEKAAGGTATAVELEDEDGVSVYNVQVGDKELKIDAGNGNVLKTEAAGADDQNNEGQAGIEDDGQPDSADGNQSQVEEAD